MPLPLGDVELSDAQVEAIANRVANILTARMNTRVTVSYDYEAMASEVALTLSSALTGVSGYPLDVATD